MKSRTVTSFFDEEYLGYARYVVNSRAIPHLIDGLKPTQRKIIYVANNVWKKGTEKPMKLFQLAGRVAADSYYHHGNSSLESSMVNMAQVFKNSLPLLKGYGQFGDLRSPEAGAPRYIEATLHPNFRLLYKDFDLLTPKIEEGCEIEPEFFLPIVPTVILNGSSGIAVGFSTNILNRNPQDVVNACLATLASKPVTELKPCVTGFSGKFTRDLDNPLRWHIDGSYQVANSNMVRITEIPPFFTCESYEEHLNMLVEKGDIIDYEDNCSGNINYEVKFHRKTLSDLVSSQKLGKLLKMSTTETENLTVIDETGVLRIFAKAEDIISHFVGVRLGYYDLRKQHLIQKLERELIMISNRARFIKDIIEGRLAINNRPKAAIESDLAELRYDQVDGSWGYLLSMPIHSLTSERFSELLQVKGEKEAELNAVRLIQPRDMYVSDLTELQRALKTT
jgi:DNA topoisomerase-2